MNNSIIDIQDMLMKEMKRLDDEEVIRKNGSVEIARSNALTGSATTYLKSINTSLRIKEVAQKSEQTVESLEKELGVSYEK